MSTNEHRRSDVDLEKIKADFEAGINDATEADRNLEVMAARFAKLGLPREEFDAMCEKAKRDQP